MKLVAILVASLVSLAFGGPLKVSKVEELAKENTCKDGKICATTSTCCNDLNNESGCCTYPNAVCCSDGRHCCPTGYECDVTSNKCINGNDVIRMLIADLTSNASAVICPGSQSECPDGNTCCKLASGQYGCCPLPNAVCCSDHLHCCPSGYTCNAGTCTQGESVVPWFEKSSATPVHVESVICPGGQAQCPDGNTCCILSSGQYGCCPLPNAVCCSDHLHCCPSGYTCGVSSGTCTQGKSVVSWFEKSSATPVQVESVICPDGQSECPDGSTCCILPSGQYGCCPLPNAVCCSDGQHCCPSGYTCDVSAGTCTQGESVVPWYEKSSATPVKVESVTCPGGQAQCPDGNTCCILSSGQYGCCPLPNAVCCSDHLHCCPSGYTCGVSSGTCTRGSSILEWSSKSSARPNVDKLQITATEPVSICPDSKTSCPSSSTCCPLMASGEWGCCPVHNAVCCDDHIHCCPSGYSCGTNSCQKGSKHLPLLSKSTGLLKLTLEGQEEPEPEVKVHDNKHLLFRPDEPRTGSVICPGGKMECEDGNACCLLAGGDYSCCPLPQAVSPHKESGDKMMCPDEISSCPTGSTCCQTPGNIYGCCPYQAAICCSDLIHCCPSDYSCNSSTGTCTKDDHIIPWVGKIPTL